MPVLRDGSYNELIAPQFICVKFVTINIIIIMGLRRPSKSNIWIVGTC